MKKVLIVVDMQNDFINGVLGSSQAQAIVENVRSKIAKYKEQDNSIIFTRDSHFDNYLETQEGKNLPIKHCIYDTDGWKIYDNLDEVCMDNNPDHYTIDKPTFGWKYWLTTLAPIIDTIDEIEIIGLVTNICVITNALLLKTSFPEIKIILDASCCAGTSKDAHDAALLVMKSCQIEVINEN